MKNTQKQRLLSLVATLSVATTGLSGCAGLSPLDYPHQEIGVHPVVIPVERPMTLPRYLGLDKVCHCTAVLARQTRERAAVFVPVLEPHAVALPLSHPDNALSPSPAVANVHKLKKAKAANAVKVKAVIALAKFDCASDPHVEEGLLASLDDASADVRVAAVQAVLGSTRSCGNGCGGCCSEPIRARLTRMVFEKDECGCWIEPNSKARRLARLTLDACGGPVDPGPCCGDEFPLEFPPTADPLPVSNPLQ